MPATPYTQAVISAIERREDPVDQLLEVARVVRSVVRFESDLALYGCKQRVASVEETLRQGAGDCEDFAWVCHELAVAMGVPEESLTLQHCMLPAGEQHAVLSYRRGELLIDSLLDARMRQNLNLCWMV